MSKAYREIFNQINDLITEKDLPSLKSVFAQDKDVEILFKMKDSYENTLLMKAVLSESAEIVKLFLDRGAYTHISIEARKRILWTAIQSKNSVALTKVLLEHDPTLISVVDDNGSTILMRALETKHKPLVELIFEFAKNTKPEMIEEIDQRGFNAMHYAIAYHNDEFIKKLKSLRSLRLEKMKSLKLEAEPESVEEQSAEPGSVEAQSIEPGTVEAQSVEPGSVEAQNVEPGSVEAQSVEVGTVEAQSVEPGSVEAQNIEAETVNDEAVEVSLYDAWITKTPTEARSLENKMKRDNVLSRYTLVKETGHALGLSQMISSFPKYDPLETEGVFEVLDAGLLFQKLINRYLANKALHHGKDTNLKKYLNQYKEMTDLLVEYLKSDGNVTEKTLVDRFFKEGKPVLLQVRLPRHAYGILLFKGIFGDCLAIINRGSGKLKDSISIFLIPNDKKNLINEDFIKKLDSHDKKVVDDLLNNIIGPQNPFATGKLKDQRHGTCAFVCVFKGPEFPFFMLSYLNDFLNDIDYLKKIGIAENEHFNPKLIELAKEKAYSDYKLLTNDMVRNGFLDILIDLYQTSKADKTKLFVLYLFEAIIYEHHGIKIDLDNKKTLKHTFEVQRIMKILKNISIKHAKQLIVRLNNRRVSLLMIAFNDENKQMIKFLMNPLIFDKSFINLNIINPNTCINVIDFVDDKIKLQKIYAKALEENKDNAEKYAQIIKYGLDHGVHEYTLKDLLNIRDIAVYKYLFSNLECLYLFENLDSFFIGRVNEVGETLIILAIKWLEPKEAVIIIKDMIKKGFDILQKNKHGFDALYFIDEKIKELQNQSGQYTQKSLEEKRHYLAEIREMYIQKKMNESAEVHNQMIEFIKKFKQDPFQAIGIEKESLNLSMEKLLELVNDKKAVYYQKRRAEISEIETNVFKYIFKGNPDPNDKVEAEQLKYVLASFGTSEIKDMLKTLNDDTNEMSRRDRP